MITDIHEPQAEQKRTPFYQRINELGYNICFMYIHLLGVLHPFLVTPSVVRQYNSSIYSPEMKHI